MGAYKTYRVAGQNLGQTAATVTQADITGELARRGYAVEVPEPVVHHVPVVRTLTKSMAVNVALDEGIVRLSITHTPSRPYRCPTGSCPVPKSRWDLLVTWCVTVANGYLTGIYGLPGWAQTQHQAGTLTGIRLSGPGRLSGFGDWIGENPWFLKSVGDSITNYGEHLTAKQVEAAIKANTDKQLTKDDAMALVAALQAGGYVAPGQTETIAKGATMAAQPSWLMPALIGGGVLLTVMLMKQK